MTDSAVTGDPAADTFVVDPARGGGVVDPVFGLVRCGRLNGFWSVDNPALGLAQLTGGVRVLTALGDGFICGPRGWTWRSAGRSVELDGHRYRLRHTSLRRARLLRDGEPVGWIRLGRRYEIIRWADPTDRVSALIGHLLAAH